MDDITVTLTREERKAAKKVKNAEYYQKNREKILKQSAEYRANNKEKIAAYDAAYRANHKEELATYKAEYYQKHKDKVLTKRAERYQKYKDEVLAKQAEYREKHKDEIAAYRANNREKILEHNAEYRSTPFGRAKNLESNYKRHDEESNRGDCTIDAQWIMDNIFSGQVCHYCGESDWKLLGCDRKDSSLPHTPENCVPSCKYCNEKKHTTPYEEFMKRIGKVA